MGKKNENLRQERIGMININQEGYFMKIIEYDNVSNIIVEFQDNYKAKVHTGFNCFKKGTVRNPYHANVFEVGIVGNKYYTTYIDEFGKSKNIKEYRTWHDMIRRCYDEKYKYHTYINSIVCDEWLLYENFYEWLHSQENFEKWIILEHSALDKDILTKGNKIYSPYTCCLVPVNVNNLFTKTNLRRGDLPIGVSYNKGRGKKYIAYCSYTYYTCKKHIHLGCYDTPEEAFCVYKEFKENLIRQIAQEEYDKGNITKKCYDAMMNYQVEITD